jgi:nicotinate-nucleotide pyrophosphorylase (carboxylating)
MKIDSKYLAALIKNTISEDIGSGDITTDAVIKRNNPVRGIIRARQDGIICGHDVARAVFRFFDEKARYSIKVKDGQRVISNTVIAEVHTNLKSVLKGERIALNFLMHLSGIATLTGQYVEAIKEFKAIILDTRKTTPGLRMLEKYAVRTGGGDNHRIGLYDMFLIKDNHIKAAGSISAAIEACLKKRSKRRTKIEIETKFGYEIREALEYKIDRIMLDNMPPYMIKKAVEFIRKHKKKVEIEASGNVNLKTIKRIARTGVDFISIGRLTHSAPAMDISMDIINNA